MALDAAEMGTWLWRIPTDEQVLDESLRRLMGLRPEDAVMSLDDFLRAAHQEDRGRVRAEFERCLRDGGDFNVDFRVVWPDGSLHWLRDQGKVFSDGAGRPLFMTGRAWTSPSASATRRSCARPMRVGCQRTIGEPYLNE